MRIQNKISLFLDSVQLKSLGRELIYADCCNIHIGPPDCYFRFIITNFRRLAFASHSVNLGRSIPLTFQLSIITTQQRSSGRKKIENTNPKVTHLP